MEVLVIFTRRVQNEPLPMAFTLNISTEYVYNIRLSMVVCTGTRIVENENSAAADGRYACAITMCT